jgi:hypothetical protein
MSQAATQTNLATAASERSGIRSRPQPFAGLIDTVIVEEPAQFSFPGSVSRPLAEAAWVWTYRDLCADLISAESVANGRFGGDDLEVILPQVMGRMRDGLLAGDKDPEARQRLRAMLGSDEAREALPTVLGALRARSLLVKAQSFGQAINNMADEQALASAIQSMPLQDPPLASLLFHAAVGRVANPTRLITAIIKLAGNATEASIVRHGFGPLVEAVLAHAQNQLHLLQPGGTFADTDLVCRGLDRFHRLVRALTGYIEFSRGSPWTTKLTGITRQVSARIEPRLRDVLPDLNQSLRKGREGTIDRLDGDRLLAALNGIYLLRTIRDCRDSLALNALFDQAWTQSGEALELHLQRNLDLIRQNPSDANVRARLDAGIKMAEIRFNPEYAETLRRARATAERFG